MTIVAQQDSEQEQVDHRVRPQQRRAQRTRDAVIAGAARTIACDGKRRHR